MGNEFIIRILASLVDPSKRLKVQYSKNQFILAFLKRLVDSNSSFCS